MEGFSKVCHTSFQTSVLSGFSYCSSPSTLKPGEVEGVASIDIVLPCSASFEEERL